MDHDQQVERSLTVYRQKYLSSDLQVQESTQYLSYILEDKFAETRRNFHPGTYLLLVLFCGVLGLFAWLSDRYINAQSRKLDISISDYKGVDLDDVIKTIDNSNKFKQKLDQVNGELGALRDKLRASQESSQSQTAAAREEAARLAEQIAAKEREQAALTENVAKVKQQMEQSLSKAQEDLQKANLESRKRLDEASRAAEEKLQSTARAFEEQQQRMRDDFENRIQKLVSRQQDLTEEVGALRRENAAQRTAYEKEQDRSRQNASNTEARLRAEVEAREARAAALADEGRELAARLRDTESNAQAREGRVKELEQTASRSAERLKQLENSTGLLAGYRRYIDKLLQNRSEGGTIIDAANPQALVVQVSGLYELTEGSTGTVLRGEEEVIAELVFYRTADGMRARVSSAQPGKSVRALDRIVINLR